MPIRTVTEPAVILGVSLFSRRRQLTKPTAASTTSVADIGRRARRSRFAVVLPIPSRIELGTRSLSKGREGAENRTKSPDGGGVS